MMRRVIVIAIGVLGLAIFGSIFVSLFEEINKALSLTYSMILHLVLLISTVAMIYTSTFNTVKEELRVKVQPSPSSQLQPNISPELIQDEGDTLSQPSSNGGNQQEEVDLQKRLKSEDE